ncbi:T9SS type B sorting domain-containing protein [Seonamhaeicola algicola]|uniref:T9SS type B sorting domain-containing protein n=1 Tax=Seonamhaeicola algicola TaxID=1719036 RepID=A0A5C7AHY9_9FLAO|nr:T9SS type B sorting domain-containing protein [Seonamhaeicola algicola]TXE07083.1 T9SS type B sorting domain-containing protein [Seonamhaeicola algicola]
MRFLYIFILTFICSCSVVFSQQISVDSSVGVQQLIEDNFVDGCVEITNITSSVNGSASGFPSYAYFERGASNFPFENGIMLATGSANSGGNSERTPTLSEGSTTWGTDPDIETALGINNTLNATSIEFDFTSTSSQFQFNYLYASEEYFDINPCQISDNFVFLIREAGTSNPYRNIAVVPGTNQPVNSTTVHNEIFGVCPPENEEYFDVYNAGDTNYNGRTTVLTAAETIVPYVQYHVKLIIADQRDGTFDSAVFIEGNSFEILDLGEDIETCASSVILDADIENASATYRWFLNNTEIAGETNPTLNAIQDGNYRVEVSVLLNANNCIEEDEINIVLNSEEPINPITDYQMCDDSSGDGTETFDLSTKNAELIANIPFTNYTFSYHFSETDARSNVGAINAPISNTSNPQAIFVRIDDTDTDCFAYTTFNLIVNEAPNATPPTPLEVCDSDDTPDGYTVIDLTVKDSEISGGNSNFMVSYHYNALDASTGSNPIPGSYVNTNTPTDTVYVRIVNVNTGCFNTTTLTVNMTTSPIINRDTQFLDACDTDHDGNADFDLTQAINDILGGLTNITVSYHESFTDAETDTNPIADPTNYEYTNPAGEPGSRNIYVRVEDNNTGCASITLIEAHTNLLLTGTDTGDFALCDVNDDQNDTLNFNLNIVETFINNDLPNPITVTFFETEDNLNNNTNAIDKGSPYPALSPTTLYIRLEDTNSGCVDTAEITLLVNPILMFESVDPIPYCDTDGDGIVSIDLHSLDDMITNSNTNFTVTYFGSNSDAENNTNALPDFYTNTNSVETLYARIENDNSGCSTVNPFDIEVVVAPDTTPPSPFVICDDDQDGFFTINLEDKIPEMITNTNGIDINFFTTENDAFNSTNAITNPTNFNAETQTIYTRLEYAVSGCFNITPIDVYVNTLPIIPSDLDFQICEETGTTVADFILSDMDVNVLNGQTGKEVYYFENQNDALNGNLANAIDKNNVYQNTSSPQTIYIRVENLTASAGTCFATSSMTIQVSPEPIYNPIVDFLVCDDISNDGTHVFDLNAKRTEIASGSPDNLNISFHTTFNDADTNTNPLGGTYTNTQNPQTIYIRIESEDSFCHVVEPLGMNIIAAPDISEVSGPLVACDADYDGITSFNLEDADYEMRDRITDDLEVYYFENFNDINPNDGFDNTNAISNPTNFNSASQTVYIKVVNSLTGCYSVISQELVVNLPPSTNNVGTIEICDNDTNFYDLLQVNPLLVNDVNTVTISYHNNEPDATANANPINTNYNYTANFQTLFVRVTTISTGCAIVTSFNLQVNPNPVANTTPDLVACDDDFDGFFEFNLSTTANTILGSQNGNNYTVTYFTTNTDAQNNQNPLSIMHAAFNGEVIYARVEDNATGCFDVTNFSTRVNPLPVIPIDDVVPLCINNLPLVIDAYTGNDSDTYQWSTGATTPQIILTNPSQIGNYWVSVTTPNFIGDDCEYTHSFTVIESQEADINFTTTVNFADPNSITVNVSGIGDYIYILDDGEPQTSNIFENVTYGPHLVTIRDLNGCTDATRTVVVIDVPKYFTPNNDSFNDTWHIVGIEEIPGTIVYIYNRHGKLIKTLPHTSVGWDGTFNGNNMPADDYWFSADVLHEGEAFTVKGHFALKR